MEQIEVFAKITNEKVPADSNLRFGGHEGRLYKRVMVILSINTHVPTMKPLTLEVKDDEGNGAPVTPNFHVVADDTTSLKSEPIGNYKVRRQLNVLAAGTHRGR